MSKSALLVSNHMSGSYDDCNVEEIARALSASGYELAKELDCASGEVPDATALNDGAYAMLVVLGGDGTLQSVLSKAAGWGGTALALPGGTQNLLCKSLYGDRDVGQVLELLEGGHLSPRRRNCINWSGGCALIEILAGPGARWSEVRESMRDGGIAETVGTTMDVAEDTLGGSWVRLAESGKGDENGYPGIRLVAENGGMVVEGYTAHDIGEIAAQGAALLGRNFRDGPHDELGTLDQVTLESVDGAVMALMCDGERVETGAREGFSLAPFDLDLLGLADG